VCLSFLGTRLLDYCGVYIYVRYCVFVLHLFLRLLLLLLLLLLLVLLLFVTAVIKGEVMRRGRNNLSDDPPNSSIGSGRLFDLFSL
jgi:hypothetical protein